MKDFIVLITASDGQAEMTKKCIESIQSKHSFEIFLLNWGTQDRAIKRLGSQVTLYQEFSKDTQITKEMNYGINLARKKTKLVVNGNNDIIVHSQTCDLMVDIFKNTDIKSLSGHIVTELDELQNYSIASNGNLYYKDNFVSVNKFKPWLEVLNKDFGFDLYSWNVWHTDYFKLTGLTDSKTFDQGIYFWDTDMQYRGTLAGIDTYVASSALYYHTCSATAKQNLKSRNRLDELYVAMKVKYRDKWGGDLRNSKYIGTQHNENYVYPFQDKITVQEFRKQVFKNGK